MVSTLLRLTIAPLVTLAMTIALLGAPPAQARVHGPAETPVPPPVDNVVIISVDGLNPRALKRLGRQRTPALHRLLRTGAGTRNARTAVERTTTLPNHTGMVTGRRVNPRHGGHGVNWNDDRRSPATVGAAAGDEVSSVFEVVHDHDGSTALFAAKTKFSLWHRSWPAAIDRIRIDENNVRLVKRFNADLRKHDRRLRFLHISLPDRAGHRHGFMTPRYLRAVRRSDRLVNRVLRTVNRTPKLAGRTSVVLTSDHGGGRGRRHRDASKLVNQRVLFVARGPGIARGAKLYAINPAYKSPKRSQPRYASPRTPVRNAAVGNLALHLLGLPPIPGSEHNAAHDLRVVAPG